MGRAPPDSYETESIGHARRRMAVVGPAGWHDRRSIEDYDDLGELAEEAGL